LRLSTALKMTLTPQMRERAGVAAVTIRTEGAGVAAELLLDRLAG
jgi:hypothetical protein